MANKDTINYSAADIQRYHEGNLSPSEMHALEKASLHDPFLADALEGYMHTQVAGGDIATLRKALQKRIQGEDKRTTIYSLWTNKFRVAAAIIVLAGIGWIAYQLPFSKNEDLALKKAPVENASPQATSHPELQNALSDTTVADVAVAQSPVAGSTVSKPAPSSTSLAKETAPVSVEAQSFDHRLSGRINGLQMDSVVGASAFNTPQTFRGAVTDPAGNAIPFASITVRQTNAGIQSDKNGKFEISVPDTTAIVTVNAVGYQTNQVALNNLQQNRIVLAESNQQLNEVVVTRSRAAKKVAPTHVIEGQLEPKEGWTRYDDYLAENIEAPENKLERPMSGEVSLSFDVNNDGEPINIKVEKSLCASCDRKAIQLLKQGPKWKREKGKRGKVTMRF
ncbi:MAG: hypothetical protein JWP69_48 [Flaviaesturariibacter sp.]|nr:hypothetical protein [Flaviaesturariibacter sp.]